MSSSDRSPKRPRLETASPTRATRVCSPERSREQSPARPIFEDVSLSLDEPLDAFDDLYLQPGQYGQLFGLDLPDMSTVGSTPMEDLLFPWSLDEIENADKGSTTKKESPKKKKRTPTATITSDISEDVLAGNAAEHVLAGTAAGERASVKKKDASTTEPSEEEQECRVYKCHKCGLTFTSKKPLDQHMLKKHKHPNKVIDPQEPQPKAGTADTSDKEDSALDPTVDRNPARQRLIKCPVCKARFNSIKNLRNHTKEQHQGTRFYECSLCGHMALNRKEQRRHEVRNHEPVKDDRYECPIQGCGNALFIRKDGVYMHLRVIHNINAKTTTMVINKAANIHGCTSCQKEFSQLEHLNAHVLRKHSQETRFNCPYSGCGKTFTSRAAMLAHKQFCLYLETRKTREKPESPMKSDVQEKERSRSRSRSPQKRDSSSSDSDLEFYPSIKPTEPEAKPKSPAYETEAGGIPDDPSDEEEDEEEDEASYCPMCKKECIGAPTCYSEESTGCDQCDKWFHLECLNIKKAPKTKKWYCPPCRKQRQKTKKTKTSR